MGRKKKPIKLEILEGNPGKRPIRKETTPPDDGLPNVPEFLDEYGKREWNRLISGLYVMGVVTGWDKKTLAAYCESYSTWRHAIEERQLLINKGGEIAGLVHKTTTGNWIPQPLLGIANKAKADMVRYASELGLTPSARARLAIDPKNKKSKFGNLIGVSGGKK